MIEALIIAKAYFRQGRLVLAEIWLCANIGRLISTSVNSAFHYKFNQFRILFVLRCFEKVVHLNMQI